MLRYWQGCRNENPVAAVASLIPRLYPLVLLVFCCLPLSGFSYPCIFLKCRWTASLSFGVRLLSLTFRFHTCCFQPCVVFPAPASSGFTFLPSPFTSSVHVGCVPVPTVACLPLCFLRSLVMSEGFSSVEDPHLCQALAFRQWELEVLCIF